MMSDTEKGTWQLLPLFKPQGSVCEDDILDQLDCLSTAVRAASDMSVGNFGNKV